MAQKKISELVAGTPATALTGAEQFELVQGGANKGGLLSQVLTYVLGGTVAISAFIRTLLDDANAAAARTTLGLGIGTDVAPVASPTFTGKATTAASAAGAAGLNLPHGAAPTSPVNGDVWTTAAGVSWQINGATRVTGFLGVANTWLGQQTLSGGAIYPSGASAQYNNAANDAAATIANIGGAGVSKIVVNQPLEWAPAASETPSANGRLAFQATSNTSLVVKFKGSDGVVRSVTLTLA